MFQKKFNLRLGKRATKAESETLGSRNPLSHGTHAAPSSHSYFRRHFSKRKQQSTSDTCDIGNLVSFDARSRAEQRASLRVKKHATRRVRSSHARSFVVAFLLIIVIIGAGIGAGYGFYTISVRSNEAIQSGAIKQALTPQKNKHVATVLLNVTLPQETYTGLPSHTSMLALARFDTNQQTFRILSLPYFAYLKGRQDNSLARAAERGDDALIRAVTIMTGVPVNHYISVSGNQFAALVDNLGGLSATLPKDIDDPFAGWRFLHAGEQTLDGYDALVWARATNFPKALYTQAENQALLVKSLFARLCDQTNGHTIGQSVDTLQKYIRSDMSSNAIRTMLDAVAGVDMSTWEVSALPGETVGELRTSGPQSAFVVSEKNTTQMVNSFLDDARAEKTPETHNTVDVSSFSLEVQNGTSKAGLAKEVGDYLTSCGCVVVSVGNAQQPIFKETLVVYQPQYEDAAKAVVSLLGFGRSVKNVGYYTMHSSVLVILGSDNQKLPQK